jgi:hypothetical protein
MAGTPRCGVRSACENAELTHFYQFRSGERTAQRAILPFSNPFAEKTIERTAMIRPNCFYSIGHVFFNFRRGAPWFC